jgi:hemolysin III
MGLMNTKNDQGLTSVAWDVGRTTVPANRLPRWIRDIPRQERASVLTHAAAALALVAPGAWLVWSSAGTGSVAFTMSVLVYVIALMAMFCISAIYHGEPVARRKQRLRALDHASIYLLIAGTTTPFATALGGRWGSLLLIIVWTLAAAGIAAKLLAPMQGRLISTLVYVAMGWSVLAAAIPFFGRFSSSTLLWVFTGGVVYTLGAVAYTLGRSARDHAIWHCFVIAASAFHFFAVTSLVLDASNGSVSA